MYYLCMVTDCNWTYSGDHFEMYRSIESLCCVTEMNIVLHINYTSKANNQPNKFKEKSIIFVITRDKGSGEEKLY